MDIGANTATMQFPDPTMPTHASASQPLSFHRYLPITAFYFFFNCAGLPSGMYFTGIFSPLLYLWLYARGQRWVTTKFFLVLSPFILAHELLGIASIYYYLRSLALLWTVYIAVYAICLALSHTHNLERLFRELIVLNFFATIIALVVFPTPLRPLLWRTDPIAVIDVSHLYRLNLLSIEPSEYALLMLPLLIYASLRLMRSGNLINAGYLFCVVVPLLLTQSFGGISMGLAGIGVALAGNYRRFLRRPTALIALLLLIAVIGSLALIHNPISERILQVVNGSDSSTRSRTIFSFIAAYVVASSKSLLWGVGLGQIKLYDFTGLGLGFTANIIPNDIAGTFAELGIIAVALKIAVESYLFFRLKVYLNSFRLAMFVIASITQFTGSFLTDVQEYIMWFLAFYPLFPHLDFFNDSKVKGTASRSRGA
jgi:hypothetical protein